jgi:transcriptional regulator with XRE-family HTH domain
MTLPRSHARTGRPPHAAHPVPPEMRHRMEARPPGNHPGRSALPNDSVRGAEPGRGLDSGRPHSEHVWEQRRALGRRLAALRSRSGFSQWEFAPLTGYSRSTLSDAELGRHRLRREFWQRCDEALASGGMLIAAYDQIEAQAMEVRRRARSRAQAAREEQASRRLQSLLRARAAGERAGGAAAGSPPEAPTPDVQAGPAPDPQAVAADGITWGHAVPADAATARAALADPSTLAVAERCPHCHQPVTVLIVAAPPAAGGLPSSPRQP